LTEIRVQVVYFGQAREAAETSKETFSLTRPAKIDQLLSLVRRTHPKLADIREIVRVLVNGRWASENEELRDGDRVAFLPPVGGG
jgi:MoaD family protein